MNSYELINGVTRWCIWLHEVPPNQYRQIEEIQQRIKRVYQTRKASKKLQTQQDANRSYEFQEIRQPTKPYIGVPKTSSERRHYIPMAFLSPEVIAGSEIFTIPDATPFHFGVLSSSMHMAWVRQVCGRLESRYRYSAKLVYNNYPWPVDATETQKERIAEAVQGVLDVREKYLSAGSTLADLYDPLTLPADLLRAHQGLDKTVDKTYRVKKFHTERERVEFLFALYEKLTAPMAVQMAERLKKPRRRKPKIA